MTLSVNILMLCLWPEQTNSRNSDAADFFLCLGESMFLRLYRPCYPGQLIRSARSSYLSVDICICGTGTPTSSQIAFTSLAVEGEALAPKKTRLGVGIFRVRSGVTASW